MISTTLLTRILRRDFDALDELERLAERAPQEAAHIAEAVLTAPGERDDAAVCIVMLEVLNRTRGRDAVQEWLLGHWESFDGPTRSNVACGASSPDALSTELAVRLFHLPQTSVRNRHHLVAGLASTARQRRCESLVLDLVDRIGSYDDPHRQSILEEFRSSVEESFGPRTVTGSSHR